MRGLRWELRRRRAVKAVYRSPRTRHVVSAASLAAKCCGDELGATTVNAIGTLVLFRGGDVEGALVLGASVASSYSPIGGVVDDASALVLLAHTRSPYALAAFLTTFENWEYLQTVLELLMTSRRSSPPRAS
jgi:hypothetical protein